MAASGGELDLASGRGLDRTAKRVVFGVLEQIADRSRAHGIHDLLILQHAGQRECLRIGHVSPDRRGRGHAVHHRHQQVHQHDIGPEFLGKLKRLGTIPCLTDDFELRIELKKLAQPPAYNAMIIDNEDADRHGCPPSPSFGRYDAPAKSAPINPSLIRRSLSGHIL